MSKLNIKNLQHVLSDHCNLRCDNCSTFSPLLPKSYSDLDSFKRDINKLCQFIELDTFEFIGGEPLLHKQIDEYLEFTKSTNIAKVLKVFTNGKYLVKMTDKFYSLINYIEISAYPNTKINYKKMNQFIDEKQKIYGFDYIINYKPSFRVSHKEKELNDNVTRHIYETCETAHIAKCALIKDGYYYKCNIPYFKRKLDGFDDKQDGVDIHSSEYPFNLYRYLKSKEPLESCKYCYGTSGIEVPHQQIRFHKNVKT